MEWPQHPFVEWRKSEGLSRREVCEELAKLGHHADPRFLEAIENGRRRPEYSLGEGLEAVCDGVVSVAVFMKFPLRPRTDSKKKRAA